MRFEKIAVLLLPFVLAGLVATTPLNKRTPDGSCGGSRGYICEPGTCCSQYGWCGSSTQHCGAGCQPMLGQCTDNGGTTTTSLTTSPTSTRTPSPTSTSTPNTTPTPTTTPGGGRPKLGTLPYGTSIETCKIPGVIALTYDDGPYIYTDQLLDILDANDVKATFFVNGNNWADISTTSSRNLIQRMSVEGHQIGSHTYSHPYLENLDYAAIQLEMTKLETPLLSILGKFPTYMRPPYFSCSGACEPALDNLGYHIIDADLDTLDWANTGAQAIGNSKIIYKNLLDARPLTANGFVVLAHDVHEYTVTSLTAYMIDYAKSKGWRFVTVGECMGDPVENWYRTA